MEIVTKLYTQYLALMSTNPIIAATLAAMVIGFITGLVRSAPGKITNGVSSRFISTLTLKLDANWENREIYNLVTRWLYGRSKSWSKSYAVSRVDPSDGAPILQEEESPKVTYKLRCGVGTHFFFFNKKLFWYRIEQDTGGKSDSFRETLALKCFSFRPKALEDLLNEATYIEDNFDNLCIYQYAIGEGYRKVITQKRILEGVVSTGNVGERILGNIQDFFKDKEWMIKAGIPYKINFLLHGVPGTGKTSLIRAIATSVGRPLYTINVRKISDDKLMSAISDIKPGSILVFEDIDCLGDTFRKRQEGETTRPSSETSLSDSVSLSGILNTLDGIVPLNNMIVFMTTNHIDKIDPAILRKGRTDFTYEVKPLDGEAVSRFSNYIYGSPIRFNSTITGADLQHLAIENKHDFNGFCEALSKFDISV